MLQVAARDIGQLTDFSEFGAAGAIVRAAVGYGCVSSRTRKTQRMATALDSAGNRSPAKAPEPCSWPGSGSATADHSDDGPYPASRSETGDHIALVNEGSLTVAVERALSGGGPSGGRTGGMARVWFLRGPDQKAGTASTE